MKLTDATLLQNALSTLWARPEAESRLAQLQCADQVCVVFSLSGRERRLHFTPNALIPGIRADMLAQLDEARRVIRELGFSDADIVEYEQSVDRTAPVLPA